METGKNQNLGLGLTIESEITMDEINMDSIPNLASSCMLVTYTCGTWAGKVSDKRVTEDAQQQAGAQHGSGKYVKDLLGNSKALKDVKACGGDARNNIHYPMTQPFQDRGPRLLTNMKLPRRRWQRWIPHPDDSQTRRVLQAAGRLHPSVRPRQV